MTEIVRKETFFSKGCHDIIAMLMVVCGIAYIVQVCITSILNMKKAN